MGGGLRWHGVSMTGSTATSRIMNAAKAEREKANRAAPKVGSASVTDGDDWLAVAAAERAARESERAAAGLPPLPLLPPRQPAAGAPT